MQPTPKAALLPLYLELYDRVSPKNRPAAEAFADTIVAELRGQGLDIARLPVCRLKAEFDAAVRQAEQAGACAIVTLHLAYSPSLECIDALATTALPIVVCDTTPAAGYSAADQAWITHNHGIHGVQDMCNLLLRKRKAFVIEAGHHESPGVLERVAGHVRAAEGARRMRCARVGRIGPAFAGMGDFAVESDVLRRAMGVTTVAAAPENVAGLLPAAGSPEVEREIAADRERFDCTGANAESHRLSVETGLAVRRWIEQERLSAFTVNFLAITKAGRLPVMPFLEASKAMSRGIGYAGEGDVLTAALVGALAQAFGDVSFVEMFCPDWQSDLVFLSHMGEMNLDLAAAKPVLREKGWSYTDALPPAAATAAFRPGAATFVDLAPGPDETFTLIAAQVEMVAGPGEDKLAGSVRGWFRPPLPLGDFLAAYSRAGGTHHAALVYGDVTRQMASVAQFMGWRSVTIAA